MEPWYDLFVYAPDGGLLARVDVRARRDTDREWAKDIWDFLRPPRAGHDAMFLIITPERIYAWPRGAEEPVELDAQPLLGPYAERAGIRLDNVGQLAFDMLAEHWLYDLSAGCALPEGDDARLFREFKESHIVEPRAA